MKRNLLFSLGLIAMSVLLGSCLLKAAAANSSRNGSNDKGDKYRASERNFTAEEIKALKNTTTVFVLFDTDKDQREKFVQAIESTWTFTPFKVIDYFDLASYRADEYSYFMVGWFRRTTQTSTATIDRFHAYMGLYLLSQSKDKKGKTVVEETVFCREEMFIPPSQRELFYSGDGIDEVYKSADFKNWSPGMLKLYLADIQRNLAKNYRPWLYEEVNDDTELAMLASETLYIPEYTFVHRVKGSGAEQQLTPANSGLLEKYPYKYKVVSTDELSDAILSGEAKYVFDYVHANEDQLTRVYSVEKGKIYQSYSSPSFNLSAKDFAKIAKLVAK